MLKNASEVPFFIKKNKEFEIFCNFDLGFDL